MVLVQRRIFPEIMDSSSTSGSGTFFTSGRYGAGIGLNVMKDTGVHSKGFGKFQGRTWARLQ